MPSKERTRRDSRGAASNPTLPDLRSASKVIAILCGDIHLSHKPPRARAGEPDWYAAMSRPLHELRGLAKFHKVPIICAGDVFDRWAPPPELINFAIECLPHMHAIPGNHDLPYHDYKQKEKTAYWTLVQAGVITDIEPGMEHTIRLGLQVTGFPWGYEVTPNNSGEWDGINLAVVHQYLWIAGHNYPGASMDNVASAMQEALQGFDAAVFSDNHSSFLIEKYAGFEKGGSLLNCGTLMRRTADEINYKPCVGLLHEDGKISPHYLDISKDVISDAHIGSFSGDEQSDMRPFMRELRNLKLQSLSFSDAIQRFLDAYEVSHEARQMLVEALDDARTGDRQI